MEKHNQTVTDNLERIERPAEKKNKQIVGNTGMYYACYLLSKKGWNAMPTARNAKGIDIVAYSENKRFVGIQVKTISKLINVSLGSDTEFIFDYLFVVVLSHTGGKKRNNEKDEKSFPVVYVLSKDDVKGIMKHYGKNWFLRMDLFTKEKFGYKNNLHKIDMK